MLIVLLFSTHCDYTCFHVLYVNMHPYTIYSLYIISQFTGNRAYFSLISVLNLTYLVNRNYLAERVL